jgi:hypothetical protein
MYETHHDSGESDTVHSTLAVEDAEALREDRPTADLIVTIGDVDLPAFVSDGILYIQAPLPHIFEAFAEDLPEFVRDMEVRISGPRGTAFSLDRNGRPIHRATVAKSSVVRGSR